MTDVIEYIYFAVSQWNRRRNSVSAEESGALAVAGLLIVNVSTLAMLIHRLSGVLVIAREEWPVWLQYAPLIVVAAGAWFIFAKQSRRTRIEAKFRELPRARYRRIKFWASIYAFGSIFAFFGLAWTVGSEP